MLETEFLEHTNDGCINENTSRTVNEVVVVNFEDMFSDSTTTDKQLEEPVVSKTANNKTSTLTTTNNWTSYTPADLKSRSTLTSSTEVDDGHVSKKYKGYRDKMSKWVSTWISLSDQQQTAFIEQHQLKMDQMREKHSLELKHKIEIQNLKLTNEILLLQK